MKFENTEVWGFNHSLRGMRKKIIYERLYKSNKIII